MRCEAKDCKNKAKLQLSMDHFWIQNLCIKHTIQITRALIRQVYRQNRALFIQKPQVKKPKEH